MQRKFSKLILNALKINLSATWLKKLIIKLSKVFFLLHVVSPHTKSNHSNDNHSKSVTCHTKHLIWRQCALLSLFLNDFSMILTKYLVGFISFTLFHGRYYFFWGGNYYVLSKKRHMHIWVIRDTHTDYC